MAIGFFNVDMIEDKLAEQNEGNDSDKESDVTAKLSAEASMQSSQLLSSAKDATTKFLPSLEISSPKQVNTASETERGKSEKEPSKESEEPPKRAEAENVKGNKTADVFTHFKPLTAEELAQSKELVERDLRLFKTADGGNILEKVYGSLSSPDSELVLKMMAEVRENYAQQTIDGVIKAEQKGSWLHAIGELGEVIEVAKIHGLTERQTRNAMIAALFSDGQKSGWSQSSGGNFFTHHLDGARAVDTVIDRHNGYNGFLDSWEGKNFDAMDREEIRHSILEHQIGPPKFMGFAYSKEISDQINAQRQKQLTSLQEKEAREGLTGSEGLTHSMLQELSKEYDYRSRQLDYLRRLQDKDEYPTLEREHEIQQLEELQKRGRFVSPNEALDINGIEKAIADPFNSPLEFDPQGGKRLKFDAEQRDLLRRYVGKGAQNWHVPQPDAPWAKVSQTVRTADSLDNYFGQVDANGKPMKGPFKIAALRGPLSVTPDRDIFETIGAIQASEDSAKGLMDADELKVAEERSKQSEVVYKEALNSTEQFIRQRLGVPSGKPLPVVPFWNDKLSLPGPEASATERAEFANKPEVKFALEIHQHFTSELLRVRQVDSSHPLPEIKSVKDVNEVSTKPVEPVSKAVNAEMNKPAEEARQKARSTVAVEINEAKLSAGLDTYVKDSAVEKFAESLSKGGNVPKEDVLDRIAEMRRSSDPEIVRFADRLIAAHGKTEASGSELSKVGSRPIEITSEKTAGRSARFGFGLGVGTGITLSAGLQWLTSNESRPMPLKDKQPVVEKKSK